MTPPHVTADYPHQLRLQARQPGVSAGLRATLYECANIVEMMTGALEAGQLTTRDDEAVLLVRLQAAGGATTVSIFTGCDINPADPSIILAAQEALAAVQGVGVTRQ